LRLKIRKIELESTSVESQVQIAELQSRVQKLEDEYELKEQQLESLYEKSRQYFLTMATADGREKDIKLFDIVRIYQPNTMSFLRKSGFYASKVWEFVSGEPRESNTEGGIFPAIFGTVMMVMIMSVAVVPFGVVAAVYLREYAKQGFLVRLVRIAVNNLAGVPSIVYGVFGLGFFIYVIGGTIDQLFYPEALPTPTFGTGGIMWASLTLALLTVPVVIVATEEGLAAVPREIREGSLALAATKFETLWRIVLPSAMPGILTGLILAVARAAGEVAPLMITGVVKLAPTLPLDGNFPFLHLERKFMHLGFHIYDVGFQSPNVEAAIPMVYSTTLLLLVIVIMLNIVAIFIRNRLRKKLAYGVF
ncbi:MAG TPA: phosphate ABC transporter permease PstA, partial [bacterium]